MIQYSPLLIYTSNLITIFNDYICCDLRLTLNILYLSIAFQTLFSNRERALPGDNQNAYYGRTKFSYYLP